MGHLGGTRAACAAQMPRLAPPPLAGAGVGGWGDSDARFANLMVGSLSHLRAFSR